MKHIAIISFLFFMSMASAQHPYFYSINDEDELPSNEVYQVIQDDFGFMWIGCDAGLFRYDGFNFKGYNHNNQNSRSISNLMVDRDGDIWCQNFTGQIFYATEDSLHLFIDVSEKSKQFPLFTIDKKNQIWIASDSTISIYTKQKKLIKKLEHHEFFGKQKFIWTDIYYDKKGQIYVLSSNNSYVIFDIQDFNSTKFKTTINTPSRSRFFEFHQQIYLLVEENPIRKYYVVSLKKNLAIKHELKGDFNTIYKIIETETGGLLSTNKGAYYFNEYFEFNSPEVLFPKNKISNIYIDKENNYWFTSLQDGIFIVPTIELKVYNQQNSILKDNNIYALSKSADGTLYIGTYSGELYSKTKSSHHLKLLYSSEENKFRAVRKIAKINNTFYIARGQFCVEEKNQKIIKELNNSRDFIKVKDTIFFTTSDRTGFIVEKGNEIVTTILDYKGGKKIAYDSIHHITYFATTSGLFQYKNKVYSPITCLNKPLFVSDLYYENNTLWIATHTEGMFSFSNEKIKLEKNINQHLNDLLIKCFHKEGSTFIISNADGLNIIYKRGKPQRFNSVDGLAYTEINDIEFLDDTIYLATIRGLVTIPLEINDRNITQPNVKITSVYINNKLNQSSEISLNYKDNLSISFIGTAFRSRGKFHYEYRITNLNKDWLTVDSKSPVVNFQSLPPGDYIFEVVAINEDGVQSKKSAKIYIHVEAPYWQKWWFYTIITIFIIGIVAFVFILRIRYLNQKAIAKNRVLSSQLTALKAQMNPHFMYNTLNSIQDLIILNDLKSTNYYLSKFSNLMRKILSASGNNKITIDEEIEILQLYLELEKLRFGDEFEFVINKSRDVNTNWYLPSMILQPYIENALKHGLLHKKGNKKLVIDFSVNNNQLIVTIEDNGIGRKKSAEIHERQGKANPSFASKATEKRIDLLSQYDNKLYKVVIIDLTEHEEAKGTRVILQFPI